MVPVANLLVAAVQVVSGSSPLPANPKTDRACASVYFVVIGFRFEKQDEVSLMVLDDRPLIAEESPRRSKN